MSNFVSLLALELAAYRLMTATSMGRNWTVDCLVFTLIEG